MGKVILASSGKEVDEGVKAVEDVGLIAFDGLHQLEQEVGGHCFESLGLSVEEEVFHEEEELQFLSQKVLFFGLADFQDRKDQVENEHFFFLEKQVSENALAYQEIQHLHTNLEQLLQ